MVLGSLLLLAVLLPGKFDNIQNLTSTLDNGLRTPSADNCFFFVTVKFCIGSSLGSFGGKGKVSTNERNSVQRRDQIE